MSGAVSEMEDGSGGARYKWRIEKKKKKGKQRGKIEKKGKEGNDREVRKKERERE